MRISDWSSDVCSSDLLGDPGLLRRDLLYRVAEKRLMVDAQLGYPACGGRGNDVGRVQPPAQAHLDDAGIGGRAGKRQKCGRGRRFEKADLVVAVRVEHLGEQRGERLVLDQASGKSDTLVEPDKVRAGIDMDLVARRLQTGAQIGAGR